MAGYPKLNGFFCVCRYFCMKCCSARRLTTIDFKGLLFLMLFVFLLLLKFFIFIIIYVGWNNINLYQLHKNIEKILIIVLIDLIGFKKGYI